MEIMKQFYKNISKKLPKIADAISDIQSTMFKKKEKILIQRISTTHQLLFTLKQTLCDHIDILYSYELVSRQFFGEGNDSFASLIVLECNKIITMVDCYDDMLNELHQTNNSLLLAKSKWL